MKKIFALALAIVMMMAIALPAFAAASATEYSQGNVDNSDAPANTTIPDSMELEYGVAQTYVITIPEDISFTSATLKDVKRTVKADDVVIAKNEKLEIAVSSRHGWTMADYQEDNVDKDTATNVSDAVNYWFAKETGVTYAADATQFTYDAGTDDPILTVNAQTGNINTEGNSGSVDLYFSTRGTAQEGTFRDYLTFIVDVVDA